MNCILCGNLESVSFNLKTSNSLQSNTPLIKFVENIETDIIKSHCNICCECYNLINELETIELRAKEIQGKFKEFIKLNPLKTENQECLSGDTRSKMARKEYTCTVCLKSFVYKFRLDSHMRNKHSYTPDLIDNKEIVLENVKPSSAEVNDSEHLQEVSESNLNSIPISEIKSEFILQQSEVQVNDSTSNLKRRGRKRKHPNIAKPHKCSICSKEFRTLSELKGHMLSHNDHRPYICEICGQAYKHQSAFDVHMGMHNGVHPFTCVYCKKSFTQKVALLRHVPMHTGDMPYQCDLCGKRFVHHTSFKMHHLSHTGQKSYKCTICGLALMSGSHLKRHLRIHTGEKNFACVTCGRRFTEKYNLVAHEKLHNNSSSGVAQQKRQYRCQICGSCYDRKVQLEDHLVHDHQKINPSLNPP